MNKRIVKRYEIVSISLSEGYTLLINELDASTLENKSMERVEISDSDNKLISRYAEAHKEDLEKLKKNRPDESETFIIKTIFERHYDIE